MFAILVYLKEISKELKKKNKKKHPSMNDRSNKCL